MRVLFVVLAGLAAGACSAVHRPAVTPGAPMPASSAVDHSEGSFVAKDGTPLFEQQWRPKGDVVAVLVIVHGLKDHSDRYGAFAEELAQRGFAVHAFDLRGHGRSAGDRVWVRHFDDYLDDLDVFLARVRAAEPGKKIFLFGHSMGGAIVTLDAIDRKPQIAGLVLSAPALQVTPDVPKLKRGATRLTGTLFPRLAVFSLPDDRFSRDPAVVADMKKDPLVLHSAAPARTAREVLGAIRRIQAGMEQVTVPLLVLHGSADRVTNPDGSRALARRAASTDKTLVIEDGLVHDLLHEPEHEKVAGTIADWLQARAK